MTKRIEMLRNYLSGKVLPHQERQVETSDQFSASPTD